MTSTSELHRHLAGFLIEVRICFVGPMALPFTTSPPKQSIPDLSGSYSKALMRCGNHQPAEQRAHRLMDTSRALQSHAVHTKASATQIQDLAEAHAHEVEGRPCPPALICTPTSADTCNGVLEVKLRANTEHMLYPLDLTIVCYAGVCCNVVIKRFWTRTAPKHTLCNGFNFIPPSFGRLNSEILEHKQSPPPSFTDRENQTVTDRLSPRK